MQKRWRIFRISKINSRKPEQEGKPPVHEGQVEGIFDLDSAVKKDTVVLTHEPEVFLIIPEAVKAGRKN